MYAARFVVIMQDDQDSKTAVKHKKENPARIASDASHREKIRQAFQSYYYNSRKTRFFINPLD